jgi:hypothetical protein
MIVLYIINIIVLIAAIIAMTMQFFVLKMQKELTDMNNIVLGMNKLFVEKKMIVREPDCSLRGVSVHTAICNMQPILVLDLFDDKKKENDTEN